MPLLAALGALLAALGPLLGSLGRSWAAVGLLLGTLGPLLRALGVHLGRACPLLGRPWGALGAVWILGWLALGRRETLPREDPEHPGLGSQKRAQTHTHTLTFRKGGGGGAKDFGSGAAPLTLARGYQDLKILDPRHK